MLYLRMYNLKALISEKGWEWNGKKGNKIKDFAEVVLNISYSAFDNNVKSSLSGKGGFSAAQIDKMLKALNCTYEELCGVKITGQVSETFKQLLESALIASSSVLDEGKSKTESLQELKEAIINLSEYSKGRDSAFDSSEIDQTIQRIDDRIRKLKSTPSSK